MSRPALHVVELAGLFSFHGKGGRPSFGPIQIVEGIMKISHPLDASWVRLGTLLPSVQDVMIVHNYDDGWCSFSKYSCHCLNTELLGLLDDLKHHRDVAVCLELA